MDEPNLRYWLPPDVYLCRVLDAVIFLNLKTDDYPTLTNDQVQALGSVVHGWPVPPLAGREEYARRLAEKLVEAGLLTRDARLGRPAAPVTLDIDAVPAAIGVGGMSRQPIGVADVWNFLIAWAGASAVMRRRGLRDSIHAVRARKKKRTATRIDPTQLEQLVFLYRRLRCYAFAVRNRCLLHSLILVRFLARYDVYPLLIMGVRLRPSGAHAWVQQGAMILDDTPEHVRAYTPILVE
jgi:hypothetical protein